MKKVLLKFSCVILTMVLITTLVPLGVFSAEDTPLYDYQRDGDFVKVEDGDFYRYYGPTGELDTDYSDAKAVISSQSDYQKTMPYSKKGVASTASNALPSSVDLSESKYFPPVGNQGGLGSCATFSAVYYQFSYTVNQKNDVIANGENTRSPQIVYNFVNAGGTTGTNHVSNFEFLRDFGAPTLKTVPYTDLDDRNWYAYEGIWREGIRNRLDKYYVFEDVGVDDSQITSADDEDILAIKTALNDGYLLGYSTYVYSWVYSTIKENGSAPENSKFAGEECITFCDDTSGPHAMTLVGYNDDLWIDVNSNDKVDDGEMGAFKIVNSWSDGYCNDGFAWVAYDALNEKSVVENGPDSTNRMPIFTTIRSITVREQDDLSDMYIKYTLNTAKRTQHKVTFSMEYDGDVKKWDMFYGSGGGYTSASNEGSFEGTDVASDGVFVCPLDSIDEDFSYDKFESYNFSVTFEDTLKDSNELIVKEVSVVNEVTGREYKLTQSLPTSVDGDKVSFELKEPTTNNKVIYYIGFDNPTMHYKIGNSAFKEVKMNECYDRLGFNTKYIFENTTDDITLYFTDDNGNIDDNNGKLYTASDRLNFYRTVSAREKVNVTDIRIPEGYDDTVTRFYFEVDVENGFEPYNYQYTIKNLDTDSVKVIEFYSKYDKSHCFYAAGNYEITVEVMDQTGDIATFTKNILVEDLPFEFESLKSNTKKHFVGNSSSFTAITKYESIISRGNQHSMYKFDVKNIDGDIVHTVSNRSTTFNMSSKKSVADFSYIPAKAGDYTLTVSSTDGGNQYAEKIISFSVIDKIIGDTDGSGDITVMDATNIQRYLVNLINENEIYLELCDCDESALVNVMDATTLQRYLAHAGKSGAVGEVVEYIPPTEPETEPPTEKPTEQSTEVPKSNKVTFTNSFSWAGTTMYCYYWSDSNTAMTTWPGVAMTYAGTNEFNEVLYTFDVPESATYIIFTNGSKQTTDISYGGGEVRYYPILSTDSNGNNLVETW